MESQSDLAEWIREHKVCWESLPHYEKGSDGKIQVGFEVYIYAQHPSSIKANPGCVKCVEVFKKLEHIARMVLPTEHRSARYEIQQFDASFHIRPEMKLKPEIQLAIFIIHREGYFDPVDDCERKCASEIQKHLKDLGIPRKVWSERTTQNPKGM